MYKACLDKNDIVEDPHGNEYIWVPGEGYRLWLTKNAKEVKQRKEDKEER